MAKYFDYKEFEKSYLEQKNKGDFFFNDRKELEQKKDLKDLAFKEFNEQYDMNKAIDDIKTDYQNKFKEYRNNVLSNVLSYLKDEMSLDDLTDFLKGEIE